MIDLRKGDVFYNDPGTLGFCFVLLYLFGSLLDHLFTFNIVAVSLFLLASLVLHAERFLRSPSISGVSLSFLFLVIVHYLISSLNPSGCNIETKGIVSIGMLVMLLFVAPRSRLHGMVNSNVISVTILWLSAFGVLLSGSGVSLFSSLTGFEWRAGFFWEPSHLALFILPFIAYRLLIGKVSKSIFIIIAIYLLCAFSLVLLTGLAFIVCIKILGRQSPRPNLKMLFYLFLTIASLILILQVFETSYIEDRLFGVFAGSGNVDVQVTNLSSIVWLNGWSQAYESMVESSGLGLGFNQMACGRFYSVGIFSDMFSSVLGADLVLNAEDGSFMASKLVAEMGVIGVFVVVFIIYHCIVRIIGFIRINRGSVVGSLDIVALQSSGAITLLVMLFVRNSGYFSLNVILAFSLVFYNYMGRHKVLVSK